LRERFDQETCLFLKKLAWWDWLPDKIAQNIHALAVGDFDALQHTFEDI
tara:strand:- start:1308 stop:1454 length:147 start_codon:yes stop_codon:yes gene_type:complete